MKRHGIRRPVDVLTTLRLLSPRMGSILPIVTVLAVMSLSMKVEFEALFKAPLGMWRIIGRLTRISSLKDDKWYVLERVRTAVTAGDNGFQTAIGLLIYYVTTY